MVRPCWTGSGAYVICLFEYIQYSYFVTLHGTRKEGIFYTLMSCVTCMHILYESLLAYWYIEQILCLDFC